VTRTTWAILLATFASLAAPSTGQADFIDHFAVTDDVGRAKVPAFGTSRIVVITIQVDGFQPLRSEDLEAFFRPDPAPGERNFNDFYERISLGAYHTEVDILEPLPFESCPLPETYFGYEDCRIPRGGGDTAAQKLASLDVGLALMEEIFARVDEELGVDFSRYDLNGPDGEPDGWIDGVLLMHNINFGGIALPIHYLKTDGPLEYDGVKINIVGISENPLVALHEYGHLLGFADLYDELRTTKGYQYSHMGSWQYNSDPPPWTRSAASWLAGSSPLSSAPERLSMTCACGPSQTPETSFSWERGSSTSCWRTEAP
jgi:M6 family metalloprotease-like protein